MALALLLAGVPSAGAEWSVNPELRLGGGDESDVVVDPSVNRVVVPGGPFMEVVPSLGAARLFGNGARVDLDAFGSAQRFLNDQDRTLWGLTAAGSARWPISSMLLGRVSSSIDFFDDSERSTVRRYGGGGELGLAWILRALRIEGFAGGRGREYPDLTVTSGDGSSTDYAEGSVSGGVRSSVFPTGRISLHLEAALQRTTARDADFNSNSRWLRGSVSMGLTPTLLGTVYATTQFREFTERPAPENDDSFDMAAFALEWSPARQWSVELSLGLTRYEWTDGSEEDSHRLSISVARGWGGGLALPRIDSRTQAGSARWADDAGTILLRMRAPDAAAVSVAGSFNAWSSSSHPMRKATDGWWELRVPLEPGRHEYVYVVDGAWVTPPEASLTVDDGFGGRNGIIEVVEPERLRAL